MYLHVCRQQESGTQQQLIQHLQLTLQETKQTLELRNEVCAVCPVVVQLALFTGVGISARDILFIGFATACTLQKRQQ